MNLMLRGAVAGVIAVAFVFSSGCAKSSIMSLLRLDSNETAEKSFGSEDIPHSDWHELMVVAMRESAQTGKPILADFTGSAWCHWCVKLKQDVFETETFKNWSRENVILLELDYPRNGSQRPEIKQQNADLAERYNIDSYPTVLLLDSSGDVLGKLGYQADPHAWIAAAESFLSGREKTR